MKAESVLALEAQLRVLARRVRRAIAERATALDPAIGEVGYAVADHLYRHGDLRQRDLVCMLAIEKAAVSRSVSQLVDLGLVRRDVDPDDGRGHVVALTPAGRERIEAVVRARRAEFAVKLAGWEDDELDAFVAMLERYNTSLEG